MKDKPMKTTNVSETVRGKDWRLLMVERAEVLDKLRVFRARGGSPEKAYWTLEMVQHAHRVNPVN